MWQKHPDSSRTFYVLEKAFGSNRTSGDSGVFFFLSQCRCSICSCWDRSCALMSSVRELFLHAPGIIFNFLTPVWLHLMQSIATPSLSLRQRRRWVLRWFRSFFFSPSPSSRELLDCTLLSRYQLPSGVKCVVSFLWVYFLLAVYPTLTLSLFSPPLSTVLHTTWYDMCYSSTFNIPYVSIHTFVLGMNSWHVRILYCDRSTRIVLHEDSVFLPVTITFRIQSKWRVHFDMPHLSACHF